MPKKILDFTGKGGAKKIKSPKTPFTLFIWGEKRILPVRLLSFGITEEAFDASLNPIRAKVSLTLRVLSYTDLENENSSYTMYWSHQLFEKASEAVGNQNK